MKEPPEAGPGRPPLVTCQNCGSDVPAGEYCGHCGAHLPTGRAHRRDAFAAAPVEHVAHLSIVSTLFPHLPHRDGRPFQVALAGGVAIVLIFLAFHLFALATVAAVFALPVLYLMYLYEVEVYESEPWLVIGATMVMGALLGLAFTNATAGALAQLDLTGDRDTGLVVAGVAVPIAGQALMLAGPLFLYLFRSRFREPLDGVTFGAASALGFTLTSSLTALWPLISGDSLVAGGPPLDWAVRLARDGLLVAIVNASTTALITASLWLHRFDLRLRDRPWHSTLLASLVIGFGAQVALGIEGFVVSELVTDVVIVALAAAALLLYLRFVIHEALLVEGAEHEIGPDSPCPECHRMVPTMAFCPACGAARAAAPKQVRTGVGIV